jgi:hypothetical protein
MVWSGERFDMPQDRCALLALFYSRENPNCELISLVRMYPDRIIYYSTQAHQWRIQLGLSLRLFGSTVFLNGFR